MKHLLTISALLVSSLAMAQNDPFWNPDANGDDLIGVEDLVSLLAVYNTTIGIDSLVYCDHQGTQLEDWILGVYDQLIIVDSAYFEFALSGVVTEYVVGCPDPIESQWSVSDSGVITEIDSVVSYGNNYSGAGGYYFEIRKTFPSCVYCLMDFNLSRQGAQSPWNFGGQLRAFISSGTPSCPYDATSPAGNINYDILGGTNVPEQNASIVWDSLGIRRPDFDPENFVRVIPYWHYAE